MRSAPDVVYGAWARRSATVSGGVPFETQHVLWLQAGTCYADVRVPFFPGAETRCFTGRSGWDGTSGTRFRWSRHLDLAPVGGDDVGELCWEGGVLVERGMFPTPSGDVSYTEDWIRVPGSDGPFLALEDLDACLIRTGDHAITVVGNGSDLRAVYRRLDGGAWVDVWTIGSRDGSGLPSPADPPGWPVVHRGTTEGVLA